MSDGIQKPLDRLTKAPVLAFRDYSLSFSDTGIGAVLSQNTSEGKEVVLAYGNRLLNKAERNYSVTRRELLAVVTFTSQFRPYLLGRHFTLRTDHSSLQWFQNFKEPEGQLARWMEQLWEFDCPLKWEKSQQCRCTVQPHCSH